MKIIIETKPGDSNFHFFESYTAKDLPASDGNKILNKEFFYNCIVLIENNITLGRLAIYDNPNLIYKGLKAVCIGNYECIEDIVAAKLIIDRASFIAKKELGAAYLIGPVNGSTWDNYRFSLHHNTPNFFLENYHPLYYNQQFVQAGLAPIAKYISALDSEMEFDSSRLFEAEQKFREQGLTFRNINLSNYESDLKKIFCFSQAAFVDNFLFTPITWHSFLEKYAGIKSFIDPGYVVLAEDIENNIRGFIFCIHDFNNKSQKTLIVKTLARFKSPQWKGLANVLLSKIIKQARFDGYVNIIHAFMIEDANAQSNTLSKNYFGNPFKNYALYGKAL